MLLVLRLSWIFFLLPDLQDQSRLQRWVKRGPRGVSPKFPKVREAIAGILEGMGWQVGFFQEFSVIMIVIWKVIIISKVEDQQFTAISPFGEEVRLPLLSREMFNRIKIATIILQYPCKYHAKYLGNLTLPT